MENKIYTQEEFSKQIRCVSHEIRNYLSVCDMYSEIIKKNCENLNIDNQSINNAINCIKDSVKMINVSLLDLKTLNNEFKNEQFDFKTIVDKSIELAKAYTKNKDIELKAFVKNTASVYADENRLMACIVNIIKNAAEAIEITGNIEIIGEIKNNFAVIKISNNGKEIPATRRNEIFKNGYTSKKNGCGLGLAICKNYLNSQNGDIKLLKSTKKITTFEIILPIIHN